MKNTSVQSYNEEKVNGNIVTKQQQVIEWLKKNGSGTAREIGQDIPGAWRRLAELEKAGKVYVWEDVKCPVTKKYVSLYAIVPEDKGDIVKVTYVSPTRKQLEERICELERELIYKESEIASAYNEGIRFARAFTTKKVWFKFW